MCCKVVHQEVSINSVISVCALLWMIFCQCFNATGWAPARYPCWSSTSSIKAVERRWQNTVLTPIFWWPWVSCLITRSVEASVFTGEMPFLWPNQQHHSIEGLMDMFLLVAGCPACCPTNMSANWTHSNSYRFSFYRPDYEASIGQITSPICSNCSSGEEMAEHLLLSFPICEQYHDDSVDVTNVFRTTQTCVN